MLEIDLKRVKDLRENHDLKQKEESVDNLLSEIIHSNF